MMSPVEMRRTKLALVLLDIIGSTAFVQRAGAETAAKWFQFHDKMARNLCYRYGGREIDRSDGFLLSFERPIDAVNFSLNYQNTIPAKTNLDCRIGIHWGEIVEVKQDDVFVAANAKRIELEGISKNIASRTMSLCEAGQVLLTREAFLAIKNRTNRYTPKNTRYACVGLYKFKGVSTAQQIYAVGETIESLQPPPGGDKVKRLGGPKYIKKRMRDKELREHILSLCYFFGAISASYWIYLLIWVLVDPHRRLVHNIQGFEWVDDIVEFINLAIKLYQEGKL